MALVGSGVAATALARGLRDAGIPVAGLCARAPGAAAASGLPALGSPAQPSSAFASVPIVLVGVSDLAIGEVAASLAGSGGPWAGRVVLHLSGSLDSGVLAPLRERGASVASWHPLATLGRMAATGWPEGIPFFAEGDAAALAAARELTAALGGTWHELPPGSKPAYHAAATLAGNLLTVLVDAAAGILADRGIPEPRKALAALTRASLEAALLKDDLLALTGPVARGDAGTVRRNVEALAGEAAPLRAAHAALSLAANDRLAAAGRGDPQARRAVAESLLDELAAAAAEIARRRGG